MDTSALDAAAQCLRRSALTALQLMDLTSLNDADTNETIRDLCAQAVTKHGSVAAVCVWPRFVSEAKASLAKIEDGAKVRVATVVNFPSGADHLDAVVELTQQAIVDGADEIDLVLPYGNLIKAYKAAGGMAEDPMAAVRDEEWMQSQAAVAAREMVKAVKRASQGRPLKVILESADLEQFKTPVVAGGHGEEKLVQVDAKKDRCRSRSRSKGRTATRDDKRKFNLPLVKFASNISIEGGADFLKTSTGKSKQGGASVESAWCMLDEIRNLHAENQVGIKISGGVRTVEDAKKYLELAEREMVEAMVPENVDQKSKYCWAHDKNRFRFGASGLRAKLLEALGEGCQATTETSNGNPHY